jgi:beta-galactosidase/beta-glucuronidase
VKKTLCAVATALLILVRSSAQYAYVHPPINKYFYIHQFYWPAVKPGEKVYLHFDEVDHLMVVYINGKIAATHGGGFGPFKLDITAAVKQGSNEIIIPDIGAEDVNGRPSTLPLTGITTGQPGGM